MIGTQMRFEQHHLAWVLASTTTVACFGGATAYTQSRLARLDAAASTLESNAIPSLEYLGHSGVRLTRLNQLLDQLTSPRANRSALQAEAWTEVVAIDRDIDRYVTQPPLPGEHAHWRELRTDVDQALQLSRAVLDQAGASPAASVARSDAAADAVDKAVSSVLATLNFDVAQAEDLARNVRSVRAVTLRTVVALDGGSALIAALAALLAFRASRAHDALQNDHSSLLAARVAELDTFAGRVAHDILNPLGVIATALSLLGHSCDDAARTYVDRSLRALSRVQRLVDSLLAFARSGAHPDGTGASSLDGIIDTLMPDLSDAAAEHGIELAFDVAGSLRVRCSAGVLTSIVQNLVRNAIKYMGAGPVRRVTVAARAADAAVRNEIRDTGMGIPTELQAAVFDPFVRGSHEGITGSGLGLSTVKRLVESHGGRIGLQSSVGVGTLVWIELPSVVDPMAASPIRPDASSQSVV
jgi:signal transduction histidine kinase